jgi:hypothetical protein
MSVHVRCKRMDGVRSGNTCLRLRFEGAPSGGNTAIVCPPPDISGPPTNEMFGQTPYERSRFARSTRSFIILTNGAHSSESFVTWETNFGAFDPDGAN